MSVHVIPNYFKKDSIYVYALLCRDSGGPIYIKFGRSKDIVSRITSLQTGIPIEIKYIAFVDVGWSLKNACAVERSLHRQFKDRNTSGEWFKFDFDSELDKKEFNDGCRAAFKAAGYLDLWWQKVSMAAMSKYLAEERKVARDKLKKSVYGRARRDYLKSRKKIEQMAKAQRKKRNPPPEKAPVAPNCRAFFVPGD